MHEPAEPTCSALSATLGEPLRGTAAVAGAWLCLEQPGPWGHNALLQSHLDGTLGRALSRRSEASGVRVQLIRRPGRHADTLPVAPRRVYLAHTRPGTGWLREATVDDPAALLDLDFHAIASGDHGNWGQPVHHPLLLVCTNGRRDRCCAIQGRALVTGIGRRHGDGVWETSHTGGHRFAPAAVMLPSGYTYGRMDAAAADAVWSAAAAGKVVLDRCRGRSTWAQAAQAAELAVRELTHEYLADAVHVENVTGDEVQVAHRDGRRWLVTVRPEELDPPRANSCGKTAVRPIAYGISGITPNGPSC